MLKGTIIFVEENPGSKSEGVFPYIELDGGETVRIAMKDENPFENSILLGFEGKRVEVDGRFNENVVFIATDIKELAEEPKEAPEETPVEPEAESTLMEENKEKTEETEGIPEEIEEIPEESKEN